MKDDDMLRDAATLLDGASGDVLPTASLSADLFEAFTERLLAAHRHALPSMGRRIDRVNRWGRSGDKQDGIDLAGAWDDGTTVAFQCKRWATLSPSAVRTIVDETAYNADEFKLVFSGVASAAARKALSEFPAWDLWDARDLRQLLSDLPLHVQRDVLDETWSASIRRRILKGLPTDAFVATAAVRASRARDGQLLDDNAPFVGMGSRRRELTNLLQAGPELAPIIVVHGPGGTGKTRLIMEAAEAFERRRPEIPLLWLGPGVPLGVAALGELPLVASVIVVDDAHLQADDLTALVRHVLETPGARLILGSRDSAVPELRRKLIRAGIVSGGIRAFRTGRISAKAARRLVTALTQDLPVTYGFREALARVAVDVPAIAVLAVGMVRAGTLTDPFPLDEQLREAVLARFGEETLDDVPGGPPQAPRRLLSLIAALGTIDTDDDETQARLLQITGWSVAEYLSVFSALELRGLVIGAGGRFRVTTELLGDQILEHEAVIFGRDSHLVSTLWEQFGDGEYRTLLVNLAALASRLHRQGAPQVMNGVWVDVRKRVASMTLFELTMFLSDAAPAAQTQPAEFVTLLDTVLGRLDSARNKMVDESGASWFSKDGLRHHLASLYADAGATDSDLVPHVLDVLWELSKQDTRPENPNPVHPLRLIRERFADFASSPGGQTLSQVIDAVERWSGDEPTPIPLLTSIMTKHGTRMVMTDHRTVTFQPFTVSSEKTRFLRERIRKILERDARHPREKIELLKVALAPPRPGFGAEVSDAGVLAWEDDDLATVATLRRIATETSSSAARRLVRNAVDWPATHALSPAVQAAAQSLTAELDARPEDDFADLLVSSTHITVHQRLGPDASGGRGVGRYKRLEALFADVVDEVWPDQFTTAGFSHLDTQVREAAQVGGRQLWMLMHLATALLAARPQLVAPVTAAIIDNAAGPLDDLLPILLSGVSDAQLMDFTHGYPTLRPGARRAFGIAATSERWRSNRTAANALLAAGRYDEDPVVRQTFLTAYDSTATLSAVRDELMDRAATPQTIEFVLDDLGFGLRHNEEDPVIGSSEVPVLLDFLGLLPSNTSTVPHVLRAVARIDVAAALTFLNESEAPDVHIEMDEVLDGDASDVADWLLRRAATADARPVSWTSARAIGEPMPASVADILVDRVSQLAPEAVDHLTEVLAAFSAWVSHHPTLAERVVEGGSADLEARGQRLALIQNSVTPTSWSTGSGGSPELNLTIIAATKAAASTPSAELRELLEAGISRMQGWLRDAEERDDDGEDEDEDNFDDDDESTDSSIRSLE
ncbi:restriction endonuclease [Curtobacterium sp. KT1]|uniref:P-loop NTPase n=1 Tax=Curtobacterium sp. KT1 TaxID=3372858 RepID=UPI0037BFCBD0